MHSSRTVRAALELVRSGSNATEIARQLAIPRRTVREIFCRACDRLGVRWTRAKNTIYVSRKADVAILDGYIRPKQ